MKNKIYVTSITCNDETVIDIAENDIVVFTGANNCGKSQLLRDIKQLIKNKNHHKIVASEILYTKNGSPEDVISLFTPSADGYTMSYKSISTHHTNISHYWGSSDGLGDLIDLFVNHLTTEKRLSDSNNVPSYDVTTANPSNPIQVMYSDETKATEISELFHQAFNKYLTLNLRGGSMIPVHIGEKIDWTKENDRTSNEYIDKLKQQSVLENQGDGMRSFASILINLLTADHTITLIDEPEAFLHPPQARLLGKMLVNNRKNDRQLFIATHSDDFLKGLLDSESKNVKIVRIDRIKNVNHINVLENDSIKRLWNDPLLRYSNILSGLFHKKVIVCESDTDCRFYQAIMDTMYDGTDTISPDVLFTHCGGKDRIKTVVEALKALNVNVVAIADIDVLNNEHTFMGIVEAFGMEWNVIKSRWKIIYDYVRNKNAELSKDVVKQKIDELFHQITEANLSKNNINDIKKLLKRSTAWSFVKETGQIFFKGDSAIAFDEIGAICSGLYIVPVGEIECFYKKASGHGNSWVSNVLEQNLINSSDFEEARQFVKKLIE